MRNAGFAEMIDFSRPGSATYVDADGLIRIAAADVPRFDHTNGRRQLLLEGPATGLCGAETNPRLWLNIGTTVSNVVTPFGALDKAVSVQSGGETWHRRSILAEGNFDVGDRFTMQWIVKFGSSNSMRFSVRNQDLAVESYVNINSSGSSFVGLDQAGPLSAIKVEELSDGVLRVFVTVTLSGAATSVQLGAGPNSSTVGANMILYAGQFEVGEFSSSLIYNDASGSVTRPADKAQLTEPVAALLRRDEVSLLVQGQGFQGEGGRIVGDGSSRRIVGFGTSETAIYAGNANAVTIGEAARPLPAFGIAVANSIPDSAKRGSFNSEAVVSNAFPLDSGFEEVFLGRDGAGRFAPGWFDKIVIWPFRMTDEDLQTKAEPYA